MKNIILIFAGFLFLCAGCDPATDADSTKKTLTLPELVDSGIREAEEFNFCLSEEAGNETLKDITVRIKAVTDSLTDSVASSELPQDRKQKLTKEIDDLKLAFSSLESAVDSNASASQMSKACNKVRKELQAISKISK